MAEKEKAKMTASQDSGRICSLLDIAKRANATATDPREAIEKHFALFQRLTSLAKRLLLQRDYGTSAAYVQMAASYAWFHPTGLFASPELEAILKHIGAALAPVASAPKRIAQVPPRNVLHVLTEAYGLGGHTRFIWNWIRSDPGRSHSVVMTRQQDSEVPPPLKGAAESTGGKLYFLDRRPGGLLARAQALRQLATHADHVILHTHPHDVVPLIALWQNQRPPLTVMNHNDHVFWLGASMADQVAQLRDSGRKLAHRRRGVPESRCLLLPIPIDIKPGSCGRAEAKQELGLPRDTVVLLSVASAYKYSALPGTHFTDVLLPVVLKHPNVMLLVIGPAEKGEWASASRLAGGRVKALGRRGDTELFYRASDVYLDSFPFNSLTSVLEAGGYGIPVVSYCVRSAEAEVLCTDDVGLSNFTIRGCSVDDYRKQVSRLVEDANFRTKLGELTREGVIAYHTDGGWNRYLNEVYLRGGQAPLKELPDEGAARREVTELDIQLAQVFAISGWSQEFATVIRNHVALFPFRVRMDIWRKIFRSKWHSLPSLLLSDWQKTRLRLLWRWS